MAARTKLTRANKHMNANPPIPRRSLIRVGKHYLDVDDIAGIKNAKDDLFIVKLKSEPNPDYPLWIREKDLGILLKYFTIEESED